MAEDSSRPPRPKPVGTPSQGLSDRLPTNAELLHELRKHGAKPAPPRELPLISRRTRDYILVAGIGSAGIFFASFRLLSDTDTLVVLRLALTGLDHGPELKKLLPLLGREKVIARLSA